jgi:hypothetical protein
MQCFNISSTRVHKEFDTEPQQKHHFHIIPHAIILKSTK